MNSFDIFGDVEASTAADFLKFVDELEEDRVEVTEVTIRIFSGGGDADAALAIVGIIKSRPDIRWITEAYGCAESAASLIFAAGDSRRISHAAWIMTHPGKFSQKNATAEEFKNYAQYLQQYENHWASLMARYTSTPVESWDCKTESYMNADQCLNVGLATEIF